MSKVSVKLAQNVKYNQTPHNIGETIDIDAKDLEFFKVNGLIDGVAAGTQDPEKPLEQRRVDEIREVAVSLGVEGADKMTKADLLKAIEGKKADREKTARLAELKVKAESAGIEGFETMTEEELFKALGE